MKNYIFPILAILLMAGNGTAQHVNLGIKGGLNAYTISNESNNNTDPLVSFHLGILGHIHLDRQLALQPELLYSGQGAKSASNLASGKIELGYLNIPVLFQYMFDNGFRLEAGPQVGLLLSAKSKVGNLSTDIKDNLETLDAGLLVGVGYIHPPTGFGVDARYQFGLTNINKSNNFKSYNRGFQLGVFYQFKHRN